MISKTDRIDTTSFNAMNMALGANTALHHHQLATGFIMLSRTMLPDVLEHATMNTITYKALVSIPIHTIAFSCLYSIN